jgi:hypothetical protein
MCGKPDGPYPVSKTTSSFGVFFRRAMIFFASSNGHAFEFSATSRSAAAIGATVDMGPILRPGQ